MSIKNRHQSNRLNKSARPKIPINTLSLLKPFVNDEIIASPIINKPIKLQGFNALNFSNHLIFEFNNKLKKPTDQCIASKFSPFQPFLPLNRPILDLKQKTPRMWGLCKRIYLFIAFGYGQLK